MTATDRGASSAVTGPGAIVATDAVRGRLERALQRPWPWLLLALLVFWPALRGAPVYDDELNFLGNAALRDGDVGRLLLRPFFREHLCYWRPLTVLLMAAGYQGGSLFGVHAIAIAVHGLASAVAFRVAYRVSGDGRVAAAAAVVHAVHPVQVESVAWASALSDPVASLCTLQALDAMLRWLDAGRPRWPWTPGAWLLLALLAKESAVMAAPLLALVAVGVRGTRDRRVRALLAVLGIVVIAWFALHTAVSGRASGLDGGVAVLVDPASYARAFTEVLPRPVLTLVAPWPLTPFRTLELGGTDRATLVATVAALSVLALAAVVVARRWRRLSSPARVGWLLLALPLLLPALQHRALGEHPLADRYLHLPAFGFALLVACALGRRCQWLVVPAVLAAAVSFVQTNAWRDQRAFAEHSCRHAPGVAAVHLLSGKALLATTHHGDLAQLQRARAAFASALRLLDGPADDGARECHAKARCGLAWCDLLGQQRHGRVDAAALIRRFEDSLADHDDNVGGWVGLGVANALDRRFGAARRAFARAIELDELCPEAWYNLGYMQLENGDTVQARASLQRALRCDPALLPAAELLAQLR